MRTQITLCLLIIASIARKKEVKLPSETLTPILKQWKHVTSTNSNLGISTTTYPVSGLDHLVFEFTKKGFCYWRNSNSKVINGLKFDITEEKQQYKITYKNANTLLHSIAQQSQYVSYLKNNTLILIDNCTNCYNHLYIAQ